MRNPSKATKSTVTENVKRRELSLPSNSAIDKKAEAWLFMNIATNVEANAKNNGWLTLQQHLMAGPCLGVILATIILAHFIDTYWIQFFVITQLFLVGGAVMIAYSKFPSYRRGEFFTFGVRTVPNCLARYYRWGWWVFGLGMLLAAALLLAAY